MSTKGVLLAVGALVLVMYLQGCFPSVKAKGLGGDQPIPQIDSSACYDQVIATVHDQWPQMNRLQRFQVGMEAIRICEGGN